MKGCLALAVLLLCAVVARSDAADAKFPQGAWSVGVSGGIAFLTLADINQQIRILNATELTRFEEIHHGGEWSADVRHALGKNFFLGVEAGGLSAVSHDQAGTDELRVRGTPAALAFGTAIDASGGVVVRVLGGLGALLDARFEEPGAGQVNGTAFLAHVGGEIEVRVTHGLGLAATGLIRSARLTHPDNAPYDVDFSGGAVRAGLRYTFGGKP